MQLLKLDSIDDLSEQHSRVGDVRHDLVQLLLFPQVERLAHLLLAHETALVWDIRRVYK